METYLPWNDNNLYSSTDKRNHILISAQVNHMLVFNSETNEIKKEVIPIDYEFTTSSYFDVGSDRLM